MMNFVLKKEELCIKNEELCINNDEFCKRQPETVLSSSLTRPTCDDLAGAMPVKLTHYVYPFSNSTITRTASDLQFASVPQPTLPSPTSS